MKTEIAEHMDKSEYQQFPYRFKQEKINKKEQNLIVGLEKVLHLYANVCEISYKRWACCPQVEFNRKFTYFSRIKSIIIYFFLFPNSSQLP